MKTNPSKVRTTHGTRGGIAITRLFIRIQTTRIRLGQVPKGTTEEERPLIGKKVVVEMALSNAIFTTNWDIMQAGAQRKETTTKVKEEHNW